jgi:hypothetical protein
MAQVHFFIDDTEYKQIQEKAKGVGLTISAYARHVLRDSLRKSTPQEPAEALKAARVLVPVLAEALGRTQNASPEDTEKLCKILLKKFDQGAQ